MAVYGTAVLPVGEAITVSPRVTSGQFVRLITLGEIFNPITPASGSRVSANGIDLGKYQIAALPVAPNVVHRPGMIFVYPSQDSPIVVPTPFLWMPLPEIQFTNALLPGVFMGGEPTAPSVVVDLRPVGDYSGQIYGGVVSIGVGVVYEAASNVRAVADFFKIANPGLVDALVTIWVNGVLVDPGVPVPAGSAVSDRLHLFVDPSEVIEMSSNVAGVTVHIGGVEEVGV